MLKIHQLPKVKALPIIQLPRLDFSFLALLLRVKSGWTKVGGAIVNLAKVGFTLTRKVSRQKGSLAFSNTVRPPFLFQKFCKASLQNIIHRYSKHCEKIINHKCQTSRIACDDANVII